MYFSYERLKLLNYWIFRLLLNVPKICVIFRYFGSFKTVNVSNFWNPRNPIDYLNARGRKKSSIRRKCFDYCISIYSISRFICFCLDRIKKPICRVPRDLWKGKTSTKYEKFCPFIPHSQDVSQRRIKMAKINILLFTMKPEAMANVTFV